VQISGNNKIGGAASDPVVVRVAARGVAAGRVTRVGSFQEIGCGVGCFAIRTRSHGELQCYSGGKFISILKEYLFISSYKQLED